jgi:hypothetical protein
VAHANKGRRWLPAISGVGVAIALTGLLLSLRDDGHDARQAPAQTREPTAGRSLRGTPPALHAASGPATEPSPTSLELSPAPTLPPAPANRPPAAIGPDLEDEDEAQRRAARQAFARAAGLDADHASNFEAALDRFASAVTDIAGNQAATDDDDSSPSSQYRLAYQRTLEELQALPLTPTQLQAARQMLPQQVPAHARQRVDELARAVGP